MNTQDHGDYKGEEDFYHQQNKINIKPPFWRRYLWQIVAFVALALVVVFAATTVNLLLNRQQGSTPVQAQASPAPSQVLPTATLTPTTALSITATSPAVSPTPVIQTTGLPCVVDISTWTGGSQDWTVHNGALFNDGTNSNAASSGPTIQAPCQPTVANYAVEAKIQVVSNGYNACFGIVIRGNSTSNGWQGYKTDVCGLDTAYISAYGDNSPLARSPFDPGHSVHTYRAEVRDNTLKFFIDGNLVDTATDNRLLTSETGEQAGLYSQNVQLEVTSFKVVAL